MFSKLKVVFQQRRPLRFLFSRLLRDSTLLDRFKFHYNYEGFSIRLTRSALSLALWIDRDDRKGDWIFISRVLSLGDVFVDVGAHIGHLSLLASKVVGQRERCLPSIPSEDLSGFVRKCQGKWCG